VYNNHAHLRARCRVCTTAGKHHRAYVDNMNKAIAGSDLEAKSLEEVVVASWNNGSPTPVFNNAAQVRGAQALCSARCVRAVGQQQQQLLRACMRAGARRHARGAQRMVVRHARARAHGARICSLDARDDTTPPPNSQRPAQHTHTHTQVWNHTFFWESMKPNGGGEPSGKLAEAINASFGSLDEFKAQFKNAGVCVCVCVCWHPGGGVLCVQGVSAHLCAWRECAVCVC
jgi:superoxide dismutase